ncbi:MAG: hypothetical protein ACXACG_15980 [Candidatus Thorarchaeota archaeon]|jgi:hypothetical protein
MPKKKRQSIHTLRKEASKLGFRELPFQDSGIEQAYDGSTVLIFSNNRAAANMVQRSYYKVLSEKMTNIKKADDLAFYFYGGGKILILYATKKQKLDKYDRDNTYYRLDWRN